MRNIFIISVIFLSGCCFNSKPEESNKFNDFERSVIPYNDFLELNFSNEKGENFNANTNPKEIVVETNSHSERCDYSEYEEIVNTLNFPTRNLNIEISLDVRLKKVSFNLRAVSWTFDLSGQRNQMPDEYLNLHGYTFDIELESLLTSISTSGFDFENIFVFEKSNENSTIALILFSPEKGVEFIEYTDGTYLKLDD